MSGGIPPEAQERLTKLFGERVAFHETERWLYSSDLEPLPEMINKRINSFPDAVVQPVDTRELSALLDLSSSYKIPLVPRGAGTSWFGGCTPTKGGIVIDFSRMNTILEIDTKKGIVVVQPGVVWHDLEAELQKSALTLRLYPSSAISSTVGGWLASGGGVGIGSFEYGRFVDNLLEIELVTPKGIEKVAGDRLHLVYGMCGTTGFISRVTLSVKECENVIPVLAAFPSLDTLQNTLINIREKQLALWQVSFYDPVHVRLIRQAIEKQAQRAPIPEKVKEPKPPEDKYLALFVYPASRESSIKLELLNIVGANHGEILSPELANFVWEERFYPLRMKSLGPSLVASEVIVPAQNIAALIKKIRNHLMSKNISFEGTLINGGEEALLTQYELDDERRFGFPLTMPMKLVPLVVGKNLGSQPYGIGMFLTDYAEIMFGKDILLKAHIFKKSIDPDYFINPGKVFPLYLDKNSPVKSFNSLAKSTRNLTRAIRIIDKLFGGKPEGDVVDSKTNIGKLPFSKAALWDALACTRCGYCRTECPQFNAIGWESASPRGKFNFLRSYIADKVKMDERMAEMFYACTTCEQCNVVCHLKQKVEDDWALALKPAIMQQGFVPPEVTMKQVNKIFLSHNSSGAAQEKRIEWMTPDLKYKEEGPIAYFAGCQVSFNYGLRNIPINAFRILNKVGIEPVYLGSAEWCCGGSMFYVGCTDEVMEKIEHNLKEFNRRGIKTLITSCAGCWANIFHFYQIYSKRLNLKFDIDVKHIAQVVDDSIKEKRIIPKLPIDLKVTYHDPCHIGRAGGIYQAPRNVMRSIPGLHLVEMSRNREHAACCGRHLLRYMRLGTTINNSRVTEAAQTGACAVIGSCPTCENNFRTGIGVGGYGMEVIDIMDLVGYSIGLPVLSVSKLPKLLHSKKHSISQTPKKVEKYMTEKELERETGLFAPARSQYAPLSGTACDIHQFVEQAGPSDLPRPPSSC